MKKVSGKIKLELAQFRELEAFMQFSSDLDSDTKKRIDSGRRMTEILKQNVGNPIAFAMEASVIYAATNGYFDGFSPEKTSEQEEKLQDFLLREGEDVLMTITNSREIDENTEAKLRQKLDTFVARSAPTTA